MAWNSDSKYRQDEEARKARESDTSSTPSDMFRSIEQSIDTKLRVIANQYESEVRELRQRITFLEQTQVNPVEIAGTHFTKEVTKMRTEMDLMAKGVNSEIQKMQSEKEQIARFERVKLLEQQKAQQENLNTRLCLPDGESANADADVTYDFGVKNSEFH